MNDKWGFDNIHAYLHPGELAIMPTGRVFASTTLLLSLLLVAANWAFGRVDASSFVPMSAMTPAEAAERAVAFKIRSVQKLATAPDVLLLGSSLPMAVAFYSDTKHRTTNINAFVKQSEQMKLNPFQSYYEAQYFADQWSNRTDHPVSIFNLTVPACMASDAYFLLAQAVAQKKPKTVMWAIAPRDFVDNVTPPIGKTPSFSALPDFAFLSNVLPYQNFVSGADSVLSSSINFYNDRPVLKHLLQGWASSTFGRAGSLYEVAKQEQLKVQATAAATEARTAATEAATKASRVVTTPTQEVREPGWNPSLLAQYADYSHRYNPPNYHLLDAQSEQFARALAFCRNRGIKVILVNMPLPRKHAALIDKNLQDAYNKRISELATANGAMLIDLNHPDRYNADDWIDSLHVSATGADKFLAELIPLLPTSQQ
jgi:hypothetical protein